jgi:transcriptional regulator with XRE-family HTH domain
LHKYESYAVFAAMETYASVLEFERLPPEPVEGTFSAAQCRAARGLLNWSQSELCKMAKVGIRTLGDFERESHTPNHYLLTDIRSALEAAGIEFFSWEEGGGAGVRLAATYRHRAELKPPAHLRDNSTQGMPPP